MTVQLLIDEGYELNAACQNGRCLRTARLDLAMLKAKLGPEHSTMAPDLTPRLRCTKCGGKQVGLILHPPMRRGIPPAGRSNANG